MSKEEYLEKLSNELQISKNMLNKFIYIVGTNKENIKDYSLNSSCSIARKDNGFNISYTAKMINNKDEKIVDLQNQLALTERALELACEDISSLHREKKLKARTKLVLTCEPFGFMNLKEHFYKEAKEMMKSE